MTSKIASVFMYLSAALWPPSAYASSARRTCSALRSSSEYTATVAMPISRQVLITRTAISPLLAIRTFFNTATSVLSLLFSSTRLTNSNVCGVTPIVWRVEHFDEIDSTNTYLATKVTDDAPEGLVAIADFQSSGRGRLDRSWESPPRASLLCSILLHPELDAD